MAACIAIFLTVPAVAGWAQDQKQLPHPDAKDLTGETASSKLDESYEPKGIELGQFLLFPQIEAGTTLNTNVYATPYDTKSDIIGVVSPQLRLQSRFENHALNVLAQADRYNYVTYDTDNHLDAHIAVDGRVDVTKSTEINGFIDGFHRHEDRGDPNANSAAVKPTMTEGFNSLAGIKHTMGPWAVGGSFSVDRYTYADVATNTGGMIANKDRDRWERALTQRGSYEFKPGYSVVVQTAENQREYDRRDSASNNVLRDSKGYRVESGLGLDISQLIKGDLLAGYMRQNYEDPSLSSVSGYSLHLALNWTPTAQTLVVPGLIREVQETTQAGASSMVHTAGSLSVRHELMRNLTVNGGFTAARDQYEGAGGAAWTTEERLGATYAFRPELYLRGEVSEKIKRAQNEGAGFNQTLMMLRLGMRL